MAITSAKALARFVVHHVRRVSRLMLSRSIARVWLMVKGGRGKAHFTGLAAKSLDALGVFSAVETAIFYGARRSAAGAIRGYSVEPPCSTDGKTIPEYL